MLNKVILMGRLTAHPELKHTTTAAAVTQFTLAVNRDFVKDGQQSTDFINIISWGKTAEFASKYFNKGQLVAVEGRLQVRTYEGKDGNKRTATEVVADKLHFAESKNNSNNSNSLDDFDELLDIDDSDLPF